MIYLCGVSHDYQCYGCGNNDKANSLKAEIEKIIPKYDIAVLAEEYNEDSVRENKGTETVLQDLANGQDDLEHVFCEMSSEERQKAGIMTIPEIRHLAFMKGEELSDDDINKAEEAFFPQREQYWLNTMNDYLDKD